jgi:4-hydroxyphenylacetate 3-monooxygenase
MRSGADYRESRRDGRQVWVLGERIDDITTHPATAAVVDAYAEWYDQHQDPAWQDVLFTGPDRDGPRRPRAFEVPRTAEDLRVLGDTICAQSFPSAGNLTHPPGYGPWILLGPMDTVCSFGPADRAAAARAYYDRVAREALHVVGFYAVPSTDRLRPQAERLTPRVVKETDGGIVVRGSMGMGTSACYADVAYVNPMQGMMLPEQAIWFAVPVNAPGVTVLARKPAARVADRFLYPLSARYDELDCAMRLDDVFVPWEQVFVYRDPDFCRKFMIRTLNWVPFYHQARTLAWAEFSLGLALATTEMQGTRDTAEVVEHLTDLILQTETLRTALHATAADATLSPAGTAMPHVMSMTVGMSLALEYRPRMAHTVRVLAGHQVMIAPSREDLAAAGIGPAIAPSYESDGIAAHQRAALLHLLADHTASALEGRADAFEGLATSGPTAWRKRAQDAFTSYGDLVNGVLAVLEEADRPDLQPKRVGTGWGPPADRAVVQQAHG